MTAASDNLGATDEEIIEDLREEVSRYSAAMVAEDRRANIAENALAQLSERNRVLVGALRFYANPDNYLKGASPMTPYVDGEPNQLKGRYDGGDIARAALRSCGGE